MIILFNYFLEKQKEELLNIVGGGIHPLILKLRGPGTNFKY